MSIFLSFNLLQPHRYSPSAQILLQFFYRQLTVVKQTRRQYRSRIRLLYHVRKILFAARAA